MRTIYAVFDDEGRPTAFYDPAVNGEAIPADAAEISIPDWQAYLGDPDRFRQRDGRRTEVAIPAPALAVPGSASKLGLKRALAEQGAWEAVKAALASDPDLQEDWDLATEIRRADPLTRAMVAQLGLTDAKVDALLIRAAELVA